MTPRSERRGLSFRAHLNVTENPRFSPRSAKGSRGFRRPREGARSAASGRGKPRLSSDAAQRAASEKPASLECLRFPFLYVSEFRYIY